jgi:hypothetical protein
LKFGHSIILAASISACTEAQSADRWIQIAGPDETVISAEQFGCSMPETAGNGAAAADVPDAPPRAFRQASGDIMLIAAHHNNIPWYTSDLTKFRRKNCSSILPSDENPSPAKFADQAWIVGFYTQNGKDVFALVHNEYHGAAHIPSCKQRLAKGQDYWAAICLQISMLGYVSHDQGNSFKPLQVDAPVLASTNDKIGPDNYTTAIRFGLHDPSNIVKNPNDGFYYFVSGVDPSPRQQGGLCAFRSKDPLTQPWLAWDGAGFNTAMGSPYEKKGKSCATVKKWGTYIPAISYNTVLKKFLAIGRSDTHHLVALTSPDLVNWSPEINLRDSVQLNWWKPLSRDPDPDSYWTIIDPLSKSPFFDTSGSNPYVYYVSWRTNLLRPLSRVRDIKRFKLAITSTGG